MVAETETPVPITPVTRRSFSLEFKRYAVRYIDNALRCKLKDFTNSVPMIVMVEVMCDPIFCAHVSTPEQDGRAHHRTFYHFHQPRTP